MDTRPKHAQPAILICFLLGALTLATFWPVVHHEFINYDDGEYVSENPHVNHGLTWKGAVWAFSSSYASNWHPLTWLSHSLDVQLFGLRPGAHHLINLLFHAANTLLLFWVLESMTGALWRSALVAALFAIHPLHVESVAWVAERKDVLSAFFFMLTLLAYKAYVSSVERQVSSVRSGTRNTERGAVSSGHASRFPFPVSRFYLLALLFFALGLLSKPMLVSLPFVLLLLDYWPLGRLERATFGRLLREKIPFLALSAISCAITFHVQRSAGAMMPLRGISVAGRVENAVVAYVRYLVKTVWPSGLVLPYPLPPSWPIEQVLGALLLLLAISVGVFLLARRRPFLVVGWFWFLGMLVPVIGLVQVGMQAMADRYTYLPLIGVFVMAVWQVAEVSGQWSVVTRRATQVAAVCLILACALAARHQGNYWHDSITLFTHAFEVSPSAVEARHNLALALSNAGRLDEAISHFNTVLQSEPDDAETHFHLAAALNQQGNAKAAVQHYRQGLRATPKSPDALNNLAWILATNPDAQVRNGAEAVELAEKACKLTAYKRPMLLGTLAAAYGEAGRFPDAISLGERAKALAEQNGQIELAAKNQKLLELYRAGRPFREGMSLN